MKKSNVFRPVFSLSNDDVLQHSPHEKHRRHRHKEGFLAVILQGGYTEVGDTGVWRVEEGDVIAHSPYEAHHNYVGSRGAKVLLLPLISRLPSPVRAIKDIDVVADLASRSAIDAARYVVSASRAKSATISDWVDLLASDLRKDPSLRIDHWSERHGLNPSVTSRSFKKRFQCSVQQYRLASKVRMAISAIEETKSTLSAVAHDCKFADQAHMSRAISAHTGLTPAGLRSRNI